MTIRTISLIAFDAAEAPWLIARTCALAQGFGAHLTVLHAYAPVVFFDEFGSNAAVYATVRQWEEEESDKIRAIYEERVAACGLLSEFRRHSDLFGAERFLLSASRGADLVVVGTNGSPHRTPDDRTVTERIIRNLGRPVLVLGPDSAIEGPAQSALIGWSDTREATRAAHDSLALLRPGAEIQIVSVAAHGPGPKMAADGRSDFAAALHRLGYVVTLSDRDSSGAASRSEELVLAAQESGADLLVAGAFGHSQIYDYVVGAVTRDLLAASPLPVLLSK
ncbi:universal stress protein [Poseidonocella sp. HB161398]|uniref:universal stress protein n=1 Tax=Poseidonocella sp. HB161398 TaxID=2320855 RepID=UPI0014865840|nr:universal stress protein [Poseidonocella sp. HB161398]